MNIQLMFLLAMVACSHAVSCPQFWHLYHGACYRYFGKRVNWAQAEESCNEHFGKNGMGRLVSIHDVEENDFVYQLFLDSIHDTPQYTSAPGTPVYGVWIGMHQTASDGPWVYTDGTPADFFHWRSGQPDNNYYGQGSEDCVHQWRRNQAADDIVRKWNDMRCDLEMAFVCKVEVE